MQSISFAFRKIASRKLSTHTSRRLISTLRLPRVSGHAAFRRQSGVFSSAAPSFRSARCYSSGASTDAPLLTGLTIVKGDAVNMKADMGKEVFVVEVRFLVPFLLSCTFDNIFLSITTVLGHMVSTMPRYDPACPSLPFVYPCA
jgi:hypothetical protein